MVMEKMTQPLVAIPNLSHGTVEQILAINSHLIKVLVQYQNYGWIEEPEYKIYQARLQTNLTYLATAADYMAKPDPSKLAQLLQPVNMAPVTYPEKLRVQRKSDAAREKEKEKERERDKDNGKETSAQPPTLVADANAADVAADATPASLDYNPLPPFPLPVGAGLPASAASAGANPVLSAADTRAALERRFGSNASNGLV
ncbi:hypothetical protein BC830DRAFT_1090812 [Chytriomyces sp. MP71]|nr:hypothetical protein BC830DRAFT_1090812 [Chytriomyces sp. MP71]